MDPLEECRICGDKAQYNLFTDELHFESKNVKIYIVLNNFLFEKLYAQDDFSSFICAACCSSLSDSYNFMMAVRLVEQNQKLGLPRTTIPQVIEEDPVLDCQSIEDVVEYEVAPEGEEETIIENYEAETIEIEEPVPKKQKSNSKPQTVCLPTSIVCTNFELETTNENNQSICSFKTSTVCLVRPEKSDHFEFDVSYLEHADQSSIYKCRNCVKAFSNADFLLKHILSSHLCIWCLESLENCKQLQEHSREAHSKMVCPFCDKFCGSTVNFRKHLKKQHLLTNLPQHLGVLSSQDDEL